MASAERVLFFSSAQLLAGKYRPCVACHVSARCSLLLTVTNSGTTAIMLMLRCGLLSFHGVL
jgi:hypothetical protein